MLEHMLDYMVKSIIKDIRSKTNNVFEYKKDSNRVKKLLSNIKIEIAKTKSKNTLGEANANLNTVKIYIDNIESEKELNDVIIHEIMHIIANTIIGRNIGHSKLYKDLIECYGYDRKIGMAKINRNIYIWDM